MSRAVLDSSPLRAEYTNRDTQQDAQAHKPSRPLKRSASTASLLTPPQTVVRKGRYAHSRSRGSVHGSEDEEDEVSDYGPGVSGTRRRLDFGRKRRRTERLDAVLATLDGEDPENPFWEGGKVPGKEGTNRTEGERKGKTVARTLSPPLEDIGFRGRAPVSPPPSRRQTSIHQRSRSEVAPSTPKSKGKARGGHSDTELMEDEPLRDSPNNPFLDDSPMSVTAEPVEPRTPTDRSEKPTLQYVLFVLFFISSPFPITNQPITVVVSRPHLRILCTISLLTSKNDLSFL